MLRKLIWAAMHSPYFREVRFHLHPLEWVIYRDRDSVDIHIWKAYGVPFDFPWEIDRDFKMLGGEPPPLPKPKALSDEPDYDDIPF
jgi:hypothetical protein